MGSKILLSDDVVYRPSPRPTSLVAEDAVPECSDPAFPELTVWRRVRVGWTEEGAPQFSWEHVVTGTAIVYEERSEWDSEAGVTFVEGSAVVLYDGDDIPNEACVVDCNGFRYRVFDMGRPPGRLEIRMRRTEDAEEESDAEG